MAGQIEVDAGAPAGFGFDADFALALMHEAENLAEAEARPLAHRFGGEEGFEHAGEDFGRHAAAVVADAERYIFPAGAFADLMVGELDLPGPDDQATSSVHRIAGVDAQVQYRIFHLMLVDEDTPALRLIFERSAERREGHECVS